MSTVLELIEQCTEALTGAGVVFGQGTDNAWDESTALVLSLTGLADDEANLQVSVAEGQEAQIRSLLQRRIEERVPLAYLLGRWWFAGFEFLMRPGVVVPRSPIGELLLAEMLPWLTAPRDALEVAETWGVAAPEADFRMHVSLDLKKGTARDGMLFGTAARSWVLPRRERLAVALETDAELEAGVGSLGGRGRLVRTARGTQFAREFSTWWL